ncbi:growth-regulating factor 4-like [Nymphaea colorata]|nr:growth-regulating factor 4-like [Nymphaea colorata]
MRFICFEEGKRGRFPFSFCLMEMGGGVREMVDKGNAIVDGGGGGGEGKRGGGGGGGGGGGEAEREGISPAPQKLARTDSFPFRMPPFSRCDNGPTFYNSSSEVRSSDLYDVPGGAVAAAAAATRTLQPFPVAFKSPGMASLRCPFTAAQWQELEQQALIFKHMVAAVPVPPDLLVPIRRSLAEASSISNSATAGHLGWGGFNLRFSNTTDPEPGRCRRTDGKKWRCSRDVAPDQKYCERHMHRGRPRSRKPVEVQLQRHSTNTNNSSNTTSNNSNSSGNGNSNAPLPSNSPASVSRSLPLAPPLSSTTSSCASSSSSFSSLTSPTSDPFAKPFQSSWFKLPVQTMMPSTFSDKSSRYMNWTREEIDGVVSTGRDSTAASHQWELVQSKLGEIQEQHQLKLSTIASTTPILGYHENIGLIPETDNRSSLFMGDDLTGLESTTNDQQMQPRCFIDAWSREDRWLPTTTTAATTTTTTTKSTASNLTLSPLSLSMSASGGSGGDDMHPIQMGLGVNDAEGNGGLKQQQAPNWMLPVTWQSSSPLGGPLAEVLQSSGSTAAAPNSPKGCSSKSSSSGLNLLTDGWGEGNSPRGGSPRMASSPTGVLQKTLASLSDSSSGSSPTFGAKSEIALQWLNQQPPKLPSSSGVI